jgi:hypothetical protein
MPDSVSGPVPSPVPSPCLAPISETVSANSKPTESAVKFAKRREVALARARNHAQKILNEPL